MPSVPRRSFEQRPTLNVGLAGVRFGWGLQLATLSAVCAKLGADAADVPLLWLAVPAAGLIVPPVVKALTGGGSAVSGRRGYVTAGAVVAAAALFLIPDAHGLWAAVGLIWIFNAAVNVAAPAFEAFSGGEPPVHKRTAAFLTGWLSAGAGLMLPNALPVIFRSFGVAGTTAAGLPLPVYYAFKTAAAAMLLAALYSALFSKQAAPPDDDETYPTRTPNAGPAARIARLVAETKDALTGMPAAVKQLAAVQFFTWLGLFCMWVFFAPAAAYKVFGARDAASERFDHGTEWGGWMLAVCSILSFPVMLALPALRKALGRRQMHSLALFIGGLGLLSMYVVAAPNALYLTMIGVGIAWASIVLTPHAILSRSVPDHRTAAYQMMLNAFICVPQVVASLAAGPVIRLLFAGKTADAPLYVVMAGGLFLIVAGAICMFFVEPPGLTATPLRAEDDDLLILPQTAQRVAAGER